MDQHKLALDVGVAFVRDYYSKFAATPDEIFGMYASTSVLNHRNSDEQKKPICGTDAIKEFLSKVGNEGVERKFHLHSLECVPSVNHSVLVVAKGTILMRKGNQDFSQTFVLARDPRVNSQGYYIHNDLMQLGAEVAEAPSATTPAAKPTASPPAKPTQVTKSPVRSPPPETQPAPVKEEVEEVAPVKEEAAEEVHEDPEPVGPTDAPAEPEAAAPAPAEGGLWARVAGAKASPAPAAAPPAKPAAPKEQPKPASPPKERQQQQQQPKPEPASTTWAGLVAGSVKAEAQPAQRVIAGAGKEEHKEEKKEAPPKPKAEKGGAEKREAKGTGGVAPAGTAAGTVKKYQYAALYVSRLAPGMKEADVDTVFGQFGTILGKTFRPGEFCFIDFDDHTAVKKALAASESEGVYFKTHKLSVQERKSPEQRAREREAGGGGKRGKSE